jgi:sialidase-1
LTSKLWRENPQSIAEHEKVAVHYGCTSLDLSKEVADRIKAGEFTWESGFNSDVHPPPYGQRVYANSMTRMLDFAFATKAAPKRHATPVNLVDHQSYVNGRFGLLEDAILGKGFILDHKWKRPLGESMTDLPTFQPWSLSNPSMNFHTRLRGQPSAFFWLQDMTTAS